MMTVNETANIVEGILFLSPGIVKIKDIIEHLRVDEGIIREAVEVLKKRHVEDGLEILETAGGYELTTRAEYSEHLKAFFGGMDRMKLSKAALETLAIVAYKQPVSRAEIERVRGVNSQGVTKSLLDRGLLKITGKGDGVGKPYLLATTEEFLRYMGLNSLDDMPPLESINQNI